MLRAAVAALPAQVLAQRKIPVAVAAQAASPIRAVVVVVLQAQRRAARLVAQEPEGSTQSVETAARQAAVLPAVLVDLAAERMVRLVAQAQI
jgi:hypothetical protein